MLFLSTLRKSEKFKYAILSNKIVRVLRKPIKSKTTEQDKKILLNGNELIKSIINAATLVEGRSLKGSTTVSLSAYGYALSTIHALDIGKTTNYDFTKFFSELLHKLEKVERGKKDKKNIEFLTNFFWALEDAFRTDLQGERFISPKRRREDLNVLST